MRNVLKSRPRTVEQKIIFVLKNLRFGDVIESSAELGRKAGVSCRMVREVSSQLRLKKYAYKTDKNHKYWGSEKTIKWLKTPPKGEKID